jgi:hypothetical protein
MSHVDDGTLHAYLDGELTPVERERTEGHLAGCAACRARLEEERTLIERASRLLGLAAPPERPAPPLHELRQPRRGGAGFRLPLAWAATVALAIGIGWYARGFRGPRASDGQMARVALDTPAAAPAAASPTPSTPPSPPPSPTRARSALRHDEAPAPTSLATATADRVTRESVDQRQHAAQPVAPPVAKAAPEVRGAVEAGRAAANAGAAAPSEALKDADLRRSAAWPVVGPEQARQVLGMDPAAIPGLPIRALRRNPADSSEIVVEQLVGGAVVSLFERRGDRREREAQPALGYAANERLARYVRSLRVEIEGALSADSLSALLGSIR